MVKQRSLPCERMASPLRSNGSDGVIILRAGSVGSVNRARCARS